MSKPKPFKRQMWALCDRKTGMLIDLEYLGHPTVYTSKRNASLNGISYEYDEPIVKVDFSIVPRKGQKL